jgi:hypothetical protein
MELAGDAAQALVRLQLPAPETTTGNAGSAG